MITYFLIFLVIIAIISILVITDKLPIKKKPENYLADWYKYPQCRCKGYQML